MRGIAALVLLASACGNGLQRGHVCDGSTALRLNMASIVNPGRVLPGSQVQYDNGAGFLYVDGSCRYWAQGFDAWNGARTGVLTAAQATQLEQTVHYGEWRNGHYATEGVFDADLVIFYDQTVALSCSGPCRAPSAPDFLGDLVAHFDEIIAPLWAAGTPLQETGVRVEVVPSEAPDSPFAPHLSWPLAVPLASLAEDLATASRQGFGHGVRFQADDAARLRELRATYVAGDYRKQGIYGIPVDEGGVSYLVYLRDSLPFEDDAGLVPRPH